MLSSALLLCVLVGLAACGEARDRPEDCRSSEFFNERTGRCTACPAISPPDCPDGCGWEIYKGENGCKRARCASECRTCEIGRQYSEEKGICEPCPGVPDCEQLACDGELVVEGAYRGACPEPSAFACGDCSRPKDECAVGEDGGCIDPSDSE